jgi:hypothetical protein
MKTSPPGGTVNQCQLITPVSPADRDHASRVRDSAPALVPDANALIDDTIHYARRKLATGSGFSRLTWLTGIGAARTFVPAHIPEEVDLRLEQAACDCPIRTSGGPGPSEQ